MDKPNYPRDRDNARDIAVLEERVDDYGKRIVKMEERWEAQDNQVLKWLTRAIVMLSFGALAGASDSVKKKVATLLAWFGS